MHHEISTTSGQSVFPRLPKDTPQPASTETTKIDVRIAAEDGFVLAGTRYEPPVAQATVIIYGATAVLRRFYDGFARYLAERGFRVLTFDYRGIGGSMPPGGTLRGFSASMADWALLDAKAVTVWARDLGAGDEDHPVLAVGHSFGGQLIGLLDEAHDVAGMVHVGAQLGHTSHWPVLSQPKLALFWHLLVPGFTATYGYLPAAAGLGVALPSGVARQWRRWCTTEGYLTSEYPDAVDRFAAFDRPLLSFSFSDDSFAPPAAVDALRRLLPNAVQARAHYHPSELGRSEVGHFGFFRSASAETLWPRASAFLEACLAGKVEPSAFSTAYEPSSDPISDEAIFADLSYGRD